MQPQSVQDYKKLLTDVIKKQIVILGPDITLVKARNVRGLSIADDGSVTDMQGDPQELIKQLVDQFVQLSGLIVKKTMEPLLGNSIAAVAATPIIPLVAPQQPAVNAPIPTPPQSPPIPPQNTTQETNPVSQE